MEAYIKKMREIVTNHYEHSHCAVWPNYVMLDSFQFVNGDVHATFHVGVTSAEMCLYEVIYFQNYNEFRVFCYKYTEQFDVDG